MSIGPARESPERDGAGETHIALKALGGGGPPALLLHGFGADHLSWLANQSALESVASLWALDLPGHGASGMDVGDGALATLTERVAAQLDRQGLRGLDLIGHSLGGAVALLLSATRPDLVKSITLIAPAGFGVAIDPDFLTAFPELTTPAAAEELLRRLVVRPRLIGKPLVGLVLDQLARSGAREALRRIAQGIERAGAVLDAAAASVSASAIPRLVVWGEADAINPLSRGKLAAFGGEHRFVAGAAHLPHVENPRFVNAEIAAFLTRPGG